MIEPKYQTFWRRVGAGIVDGIIFIPLGLIAKFIIYKSNSVYLIAIWDLLHAWAVVAYSVLLHGIYGQTIGKKVFKVKVLDKTETKLSMNQAILRDIGLIVSNVASSFWISLNLETYSEFITANIKDISLVPKWFFAISMMGLIWFFLEVITMLSNKKRRAIHDFIAGSVVCRNI